MKQIYSLILADYKNVLYFFPLIIVGIRGYKGTEVSLGLKLLANQPNLLLVFIIS